MIKHPEIRCIIATTTCCPLPISVVGRQIVIIQLFSEIRFAPTPIYQQMFAQKTGNNHPNPIVHITRFVQLRSEEHTSELQSRENLVCRLLLEKKKKKNKE